MTALNGSVFENGTNLNFKSQISMKSCIDYRFLIYCPARGGLALLFIESRLNEAPSCIGGNSTNVSTNF